MNESQGTFFFRKQQLSDLVYVEIDLSLGMNYIGTDAVVLNIHFQSNLVQNFSNWR